MKLVEMAQKNIKEMDAMFQFLIGFMQCTQRAPKSSGGTLKVSIPYRVHAIYLMVLKYYNANKVSIPYRVHAIWTYSDSTTKTGYTFQFLIGFMQ